MASEVWNSHATLCARTLELRGVLWAPAEPHGTISPPLKSRHRQCSRCSVYLAFPRKSSELSVRKWPLPGSEQLCVINPNSQGVKGLTQGQPHPSEAWVTLMTNLVSYHSRSPIYLNLWIPWKLHTHVSTRTHYHFQEHSRLSLVELTHLKSSKDLASTVV